MAPNMMEQDHFEGQLKEVIQDLYAMMIQTNSYGNAGPSVESRDVLRSTIATLHRNLEALHARASTDAAAQIRIPPELIQYVDTGRNPDVYTREFVEMARRFNQLMKGRKEAFLDFRNILAREITSAMPELRPSVEKVLVATGGDVAVLASKK